jgi:hypothetical protein
MLSWLGGALYRAPWVVLVAAPGAVAADARDNAAAGPLELVGATSPERDLAVARAE